MLSINKYSKEYIDDCRSRIEQQIASYQKLIATVHKLAGSKAYLLKDATQPFETDFFNSLLLVLDHLFCHRSRTLELKDGNPLNEVRLLCNSIMQNNNKLMADKYIRLHADTSILKHNTGDMIQLKEEDFVLLSNAFFEEMEAKYL